MFVPSRKLSRTAGAHVQSGLCDAIFLSLESCRLEAKACTICTTHPILSVWHDSIVHLQVIIVCRPSFICYLSAVPCLNRESD
jgi:hypothetical protein